MFPVTGTSALILAVVFGFAFGWLLHRGRVTNYDTILNQFRLRDFTVLKVMLTAIIVGGIGVLALTQMGYAKFHVRDANMLATIIGAAIFGVGMVLYGYCPGTGLAAIATGSVHALVGAAGMIFGAILYAFSFDWVRANILSVWKLGKVTLPEMVGVTPLAMYIALAAFAVAVFWFIESRRVERR
ncbi:MAG: YeeE/YedE thiosulfate transporter family protein [Beijerinckiaceae bacterium]|nr:YeeE/YedE thiosulfate transporter family protein [Beijerinckiaceae bacterium]